MLDHHVDHLASRVPVAGRHFVDVGSGTGALRGGWRGWAPASPASSKALATEEGTAAYIRDFVEGYSDLASYLDRIGRDKIKALERGPTAFLLDPYRQWILPPEALAWW